MHTNKVSLTCNMYLHWCQAFWCGCLYTVKLKRPPTNLALLVLFVHYGTLFFFFLGEDFNLTFHYQYLINNSLDSLLHNSCDVRLGNLALDQLVIPCSYFSLFSSLVCLLFYWHRAWNCDQYSRICNLIFMFATKTSWGVTNLQVE